ncbi:hypothetical protein H8356DRAFT_1724187 [Neocallimastix lanati (nom. inval.)]|jgi:hypothetical protein|uniref:Uncharacterized protein n=1 Tax=Neocallimastix californiae TaxID=1754190 RepID=A0A1Y2BFR8_9FUNG|nr:hypothetical protein H8356DRAFT_1724187 [Neocallimastix sp. JGI-2020a]ORY33337.1 hypothetical protein LY90DRAFT_705130 [Neocallimastix californiae]|eukprot:ORY33337.1 hypothetical protein LY90DRAFT_705130 [Neocallimastix californiae]
MIIKDNIVSEMPVKDNEILEIDLKLNDYLKQKVDNEIQRIKSISKLSPIPLPVKNTSIVIDFPKPKHPIAINRIEVNSGFDFKKIKQIMVSEPEPIDIKPGYSYVHVLLFTDKPLPIIIPYLYEVNLKTVTEKDKKEVLVKNNLTEWLLINSKGERTRQRVDNYLDV